MNYFDVLHVVLGLILLLLTVTWNGILVQTPKDDKNTRRVLTVMTLLAALATSVVFYL